MHQPHYSPSSSFEDSACQLKRESIGPESGQTLLKRGFSCPGDVMVPIFTFPEWKLLASTPPYNPFSIICPGVYLVFPPCTQLRLLRASSGFKTNPLVPFHAEGLLSDLLICSVAQCLHLSFCPFLGTRPPAASYGKAYH